MLKAHRFNAGLAATGLMYNQAITVLSGVLIGRIVGAADYGISNVAKNLFQIAVLITPVGLDLALQRYMSGAHLDAGRFLVLRKLRLFACSLAVLPMIGLAFGGASWLANHVYDYRDFAGILLVTFAALPFATDTAVLGGAYRGIRKPTPAILATYVFAPTARVAITMLLLVAGWRLWSIIVATSLSQVVTWLYIWQRARRHFPAMSEQDAGGWAESQAVLAFSWPMCVSLVVTAITKMTDVLVLGHYRPSSEVGQYVAVQLLVSILTLFSSALGQTLGSTVAAHFENNDNHKISATLQDNMILISLVAAPLFSVIIFWGDRIDLILGKSFSVSWYVVLILAINQLVTAMFAFSGLALSMTGRQVSEAWILGGGLIASVALCALLVPSYGAPGAAAATLVAVSGTNLIRTWFVKHRMKISIWSLAAFRPVFIAVTIGAFCKLAILELSSDRFITAIGGATVSLLLYAVMAWLFLLTRSQRDALKLIAFRRRAKSEPFL